VFGYDNVEIVGPDGQRSHVERRINEAEAAVVLRIFEMSAAGAGLTHITKTLNDAGVPAPRSQQGRPTAWATSSVRAVLRRELYRGVIVWNQTRKRDRWGRQRQHARPESEWMRLEVPALQIVSGDLWQRAHAELVRRVAQYDRGGRAHRESRYLASLVIACRRRSSGAPPTALLRLGVRVRFPPAAPVTRPASGASARSTTYLYAAVSGPEPRARSAESSLRSAQPVRLKSVSQACRAA
jgi:hypothetical protein